jgi:hypothetical protein
MSLLAALAALAALTGFATLNGGDDPAPQTLVQTSPRPVERVTLTCPRPTAAQSATTWYSAYTPPLATPGASGEPAENAGESSAALLPAPEFAPGLDEDAAADAAGEAADGDAEPVAALTEPGTPVTQSVDEAGAPALTGTAEQLLAPGWTVQQTTSVTSPGTGRGLLGTACQTPDTEFWFAGASTAETRHDYVHLTNPDEAATVVDIEVYGPEGRLDSEAGQGITVPGRSTVPVRLSTLTPDPLTDLAVQVTARTGRIGAQIEAVDERLGADWLAPVTDPAGALVLPGIPAEATSVRLAVFAPGEEDVTLDIGLAGPTGTFTPAGSESVSVTAGTVTALDLGNVTQGEPGSIVLTRSGDSAGPVVAALQIAIGDGEDGDPEMAFLPATPAVGRQATAAGNTSSGTTLALTAPEESAEVEVTYSAGNDGGEPFTETYTVDAGTTLTVVPELPDGTEGTYAATLRPAGGGPVYASRALTLGDEDARTLTVQTLPDDRSAVDVPETQQDLSVLTD